MNENREQAEVNDQSAEENSTDNQGNEDAILQSFYQLPDEVRNAIRLLPEDQRDNVVRAFDQHRADQETGFNDRLQRGRQAEDNLTELLQDPNIIAYLNNGSMPNQSQQQTQPPNQQSDFSRYGDGAEEFVKDLVSVLKQEMGVDGIKDELTNIRSTFANTQRETQWQALETFARDNGLPDPGNYQSTISMVMRQNPNLTIDQAYRVALDSQDLVNLRQPVNRPQQQNQTQEQTVNTQQNTQPPVNQPPGGNSASASARSVTEGGGDPVTEALKARLEGKPVNLIDRIKSGFSEVIKQVNERDGTNYTEDNLPR